MFTPRDNYRSKSIMTGLEKGSFLQAQGWENFQKFFGRKTWRVDGTLIIKHDLPFGKSYLYGPRIKIESRIMNHELRILKNFANETKEIAEKESAIFLKIEPRWEETEENKKLLEELGFKKSSKEIQPSKTLILDLTKSEDELLKNMHSKTRYNIRLSEKHGVKIKEAGGDSSASLGMGFEKFRQILNKTAKRDKFFTHPKEYYRKLLDINTDDFKNKLFLAEHKNKLIAGAIVNFFGKRATYLHGASSYKNRQLMAPHLLHWQIIQEAKNQGLEEYDFWGIDEKKWPGITRFKKGFGGKEVQYIGAYDLVFNQFWYKIYNLGRKLL